MNPEYRIGDHVRHTISEAIGVVTAVTLRHDFSYEVSWSHERSGWHYPTELKLHTRADRSIGFQTP